MLNSWENKKQQEKDLLSINVGGTFIFGQFDIRQQLCFYIRNQGF